jgi:hypothetical protein
MDDNEVSCEIPTSAPPGCIVNVLYCTMLIKYAQLSSMVTERLSSVQTFRQGPEEIIKTVCELDEHLHDMKDSMQHILSLDAPLDPSNLPHGITLQQALYMQHAYYGTRFDIHTVLTYPWFYSILSSTQHPAFRSQMEKSSEIVANASRAAILATKYIHIDANCPIP